MSKMFARVLAVGALTLMMGSLSAAEVKKDFTVNGWSCASCTKATVAAVKKLEGVTEAAADLKEHKLTVTFDDARVKEAAILKAVEEAGFKCNMNDKPEKKS